MTSTNPIQDNNQDAWNTVDDLDSQSVDSNWNDSDGLGSSEITTQTGDEFHGQNSSTSQAPHVTLQQIQDLEKRTQAASKGSKPDKELMKILQDLESDASEAQHDAKFTDQDHLKKADQLQSIADDLYQKAMPLLEKKEADFKGAQEAQAASEEQQNLSEKLGSTLLNSINKVGIVHYNYKEEMDGYAIAASVFTLGFGGPIDQFSVNATTDAAYTVGYHNVKSTGLGLKTYGHAADKNNGNDGDHTNGLGDVVKDKASYDALETQQTAEANDVKSMLGILGNALKEKDPAKKTELMNNALEQLGAWNTKNHDPATVYDRAQLLFNVALGELGDTNAKALFKLLPAEFTDRLTGMLKSLPQDVEEERTKKENHYFTGGGTDQQMSNTESADFIRKSVDPTASAADQTQDPSDPNGDGGGQDVTNGANEKSPDQPSDKPADKPADKPKAA